MVDRKPSSGSKRGKAASNGSAGSGKAKNGDSKNGKGKNGSDSTGGNGGGKLSKSDYLDRLQPMQVELNNLARWLQHARKRLLIIIEGRDTAGKGGVINAISETLNPRQCRTVALGKPSARQQGEW